MLQLDPSELKDLVGLLDDRESAIKQGMRIDQQRYEVGGGAVCLSSRVVWQWQCVAPLAQLGGGWMQQLAHSTAQEQHICQVQCSHIGTQCGHVQVWSKCTIVLSSNPLCLLYNSCIDIVGSPLPPSPGLWPHHGLHARGQHRGGTVQGGGGGHGSALLWTHHIRVSYGVYLCEWHSFCVCFGCGKVESTRSVRDAGVFSFPSSSLALL